MNGNNLSMLANSFLDSIWLTFFLSLEEEKERMEKGGGASWSNDETAHCQAWLNVRIKVAHFPKIAAKVAQFLPKVVRNEVFNLNVMFFRVTQKIPFQYLGYFYKKFWHQDLSKIDQSGHTETHSLPVAQTNALYF